MVSPPLTDIFFIDIETVGANSSFAELDPRLQKQWVRKAQYLKSDERDTPEQLFEQRAGIYAEFGKVVTVAVGFLTPGAGGLSLRVKAYWGHDEKELLTGVAKLLEGSIDPRKLYLCGHNIKEFDIPFTCRRMLINEVSLPSVLDIAGKKPWETRFLDTLDLWKFGDYKNYTSLELLAALFDIDSSKSDIDGSQVNAVYYGEEDGLDRIAKYCRADVVVTTNLYLKMNGESTIPPERVILV